MRTVKTHIGLILIAICMTMVFTNAAFAADPPTTAEGTCTSDATYNVPNQLQIITTVVDGVMCVLYGPESNTPECDVDMGVAEALFTSIGAQDSFRITITSVATLFVIVFGISFMLGMIQLTVMEFIIRAFKFSAVVIMINPAVWDFFYNIVGVFFQNGTDWLIARSTEIALGSVTGVNPNQPFAIIDFAIATAFSAKTFVTIISMFFTGPYGWLFGFLMVVGLGSFVAALFQGMWIYLMSSVVRAFLFGLAPIFFPMLLFQRTKHLFDGWLNQLVNAMLQPVLLFTFFSFFVVLVQAAIENILRVDICYEKGAGFYHGLPGNTLVPKPTFGGQTYDWAFEGATGVANSPAFFIDILDVIIFILLTQLAWRFNGIAINIAKELAGVSVSYNVQGALSGALSPQRGFLRKTMGASNDALKGLSKGRATGAFVRNASNALGKRPGNTGNNP